MHTIRLLSQFRIATLNVHFFTDLQGESNVHRLARVLKPMSLDVLALQEALHTDEPSGLAPKNHYHFKLLSDLLQLPHISFCSTSHEFGNGILSRHPLNSIVKYRTEPVENRYHARGMLAVKIDNEFFKDNDAKLYVTHLDQISEQIRLKQINQFEKFVHGSDGLQLIMGDFNALTFDDYSDDYFNTHIQDVRQQNSWETPCNLVTNKMKENGYHDCWREMNKEATNDRVVTCVYGTRIDYIWKRGELQNGWKINDCRIFSTEDATDHNGVLITFEKSS
jgi:endonuclease/exonuclease/phosphatase family metal-dependent hydrolase